MVFIWSCLISSNRNEATWDTVLVSGQPGYDDYLDWICPRSRSFESPYKQIHNTEKHTASHTHTHTDTQAFFCCQKRCVHEIFYVCFMCVFVYPFIFKYVSVLCMYLSALYVCVHVCVHVCFSYLKKSYQGHCRD